MRIAIIGTGYVGLVTGACMAHIGHTVTCIDRDAERINSLLQGEVPIYEPGLAEIVAAQAGANRLNFTTDLASGIVGAEAIFIAVGTPALAGGGADLSAVFACARALAPLLSGHAIIVNKSTVPVGTAQKMEQLIKSLRPDADIDVCSNPEFLREGSAITDFLQPDRIVIGTKSPRAQVVLAKLYQPLEAQGVPMLMTAREGAELIKYASNGFLAMKISFINEIANLCENLHIDVQEIAQGIGLDRRIGASFLQAGPGYGGSCFPKDTQALAHAARQAGAPLQLIETTIAVNTARRETMVSRIRKAVGGHLEGQVIAVLGLAFKAGTDDLRESAAVYIVQGLIEAGAIVQAYDPVAMKAAARELQGVVWCDNALSCCSGANAVVVATEWAEFKALDLAELRLQMTGNVLVDLRNIFEPQQAIAAGLVYHSIGRSVMASKKAAKSVKSHAKRKAMPVSNGSQRTLLN